MDSLHGFYQVALEVQDLERAEAFYRDVIGLPVLSRRPKPGEERISRVEVGVGNGAYLSLWLPGIYPLEAQGGAHVHVAFSVGRRDLEELRKRLQERGVATISEGERAIYLYDPDGNVLEISVVGSGHAEIGGPRNPRYGLSRSCVFQQWPPFPPGRANLLRNSPEEFSAAC